MKMHRPLILVPIIALFVALMFVALSCGGAESPAMAEDSSAQTFLEYSGGDGRAESAERERALAAPQAAATAAPAAPAPPAAPVAMAASKENLAADEARPAQPQGGEATQSQQQSGRQLIVEAWIGLEVDAIDASARRIEALAAQRGGWVESTEIFGESGYRSATVRIRVPAKDLENTLDALRGIGRVTDEGISSTDVTERLIDNEARLTAWYAQEKRLVTLLENAPTVEDIIEIEKRLAEVRSDIEHVEATQRDLTGRVATSLISVNLRLPARYASDPPHGRLNIASGDPSSTAAKVADRVESMNGFVGLKREHDEGQGRIVDMVVFVRSSDLVKLMDYVETLGESTGRQLDSVGPAPDSEVPDARLSLNIRSDVDLGGSLSLSASDPLEIADRIRDQAQSLGGFVEHWNESRRDDSQSVSMDLVVKSADLRAIMDYGAGLGKTEYWEYNAAGQDPASDAPNARLNVSVYTRDRDYEMWILIGVIVAAVVVVVIAVVVVVRRVRRRSQAGLSQDPEVAPAE